MLHISVQIFKKRKSLPSEITRLLQDPELCLIDEEEERQEEDLVL